MFYALVSQNPSNIWVDFAFCLYVYVCCLVILLPQFQNVWDSGVRLAFHATALSHLLSLNIL
jgi:hypothetical protein